ncbi:hypothetical protein [Kaistia terrae]|uniref:XRE family transcriptional regulator n=1 Tax=Kaistia terrae TaxID=537017 RepID=A0ABW0Q270_9HYPH|nr:hypothetical protein [Kaistia terrae]MCX5581456.1 hypothetical protein [Kaistia terrae]
MKLTSYLSDNKIDEKAFGAQLGVSEFAVRKWRYGQRVPNVATIQLISEITGGKVGFPDWLVDQARAS